MFLRAAVRTKCKDMKIEPIKIDCNGKIHKIVKYHLTQKDPLLIDSLEIGADLAGKVDIRDPSGVPRVLTTRVAKCSGGVIAEKIFTDFMERKIVKESRIKRDLSKIEIFRPNADYSKDQVDLIVRSIDEKKPILRIEVRSSFSYKTASIDNVVKYAMSLLGPYITRVKPTEEVKDFHVTIIHRVHPADLLQRSREKGIDSFIVGGATKEMFQDSKLTMFDSLDQERAWYKTIKPIWKGLDAYDIAENIVTQTLERYK